MMENIDQYQLVLAIKCRFAESGEHLYLDQVILRTGDMTECQMESDNYRLFVKTEREKNRRVA